MSWIKVLSKLSIPFIIAFITLEAGIRGVQGYMLSNAQFDQYKEIYSDERNEDYLYWHKPSANVKLENGYYNFTMITNKFGHRSMSDNIKFDESIVFLGDSIIEGASVENNETLSSLIQDKLSVPTINLGLGSSNTVQEYYLLKDKLQSSFNMKLLVLGFCLNDIDQNFYRRAFNPVVGNWEYFDSVVVDQASGKHFFKLAVDNEKDDYPVRDLLKKSEAILFVYRVYRALGGVSLSRHKGNEASSERWVNTEYFINMISSHAELNGSKFLVVIFPTRDQVNGDESFLAQDQLVSILERNGIQYFDPSYDLIAFNRNIDDKAPLFHDNVHPNALGTSIIADSLASYLKKNDKLFLSERY